MSIAPCLPDVVPFFMQECPFCAEMQNILVKGLYIHDKEVVQYPDMGYSFCNCKNIFFTKEANLIPDDGKEFRRNIDPIGELERNFGLMPSGDILGFDIPDPFFIDWRDPYQWHHWRVRENFIIWDRDSLCKEAMNIGFEVVSRKRHMEVDYKDPKTCNIVLRKP